MIVSSAPGKLYIAGEYAVVEPGYPAILVALNRFITVSLEKALDNGSITSYGDMPILWRREDDKLVLDQRDNRLFYIRKAIETVESYAKELGKDLDFYHLKVESDLESPEGKKIGLGSSAAVTVATVDVLCKHYNIDIPKKDLFKLSALSQISLNKDGSCGDIAASVFGGWIGFKTFDTDWVLKEKKKSSISNILKKEWPGLWIESLIPPKELELVIGWTGDPASTINLVENVKNAKQSKRDIYEKFLFDSKQTVEDLIKAFREKDIKKIQELISINGKLLSTMGEKLNIQIETSILKELSNIATKYNGYAKSSGAGGGDCGIAVFKGDYDIEGLEKEWNEQNIELLPLEVYNNKI